MRKVVTMDTVVASLLGAIGYGGTYFLAIYYGLNMLLATVVCMVVGMVFDRISDKIIFNSSVQRSAVKKYTVYAAFVLIFATAYILLTKYYAHSLFTDLGLQLAFIIGIPMISFFISLGIRYRKKVKLLKKYDDGENGFLFNAEAVEAVKALNGENREVFEYTGKDPVVRTATGSYVGKKSKKGVRFLGITYATAERWKEPVSVNPSEKIYEAYYFGASEIQPESNHNILTGIKQNENCLNLNIWMDTLNPEAKKPVMVYFHGGDGRYGGSANPIYHMENIAKGIPSALFVSMNYRLGLFGVVDFTGCPDADEYKDSTALSLLDQIEALKWIKANISFFGGDPDNITLAGDNTGGASIYMLATVKGVKGLFQRALLLGASSQIIQPDNGKAVELGKKLLEEFHAKSVSDLKKVSSEQLRDFSSRYYNLLETPPRDSRLVPRDIDQAYLTGTAADVEFIFGFTADEMSSWAASLAGEVSIDDMMDMYYENGKKLFGVEKAHKLDTLLQKSIQSGMNATEAKKLLVSDMGYKVGVYHDCKILSKAGSKVRCFYWDVKGDIEKLTANSVSVVTAILGNFEIAEQMGYLHDKGLTEIMQAFVDRFMNGQKLEFFNNELKGVPEIIWSSFGEEHECVMHIQKDCINMAENAFSENVRELEKMMFEE